MKQHRLSRHIQFLYYVVRRRNKEVRHNYKFLARIQGYLAALENHYKKDLELQVPAIVKERDSLRLKVDSVIYYNNKNIEYIRQIKSKIRNIPLG